eukprot:4887418-Pyramimonas_sp.AAC.1
MSTSPKPESARPRAARIMPAPGAPIARWRALAQATRARRASDHEARWSVALARPARPPCRGRKRGVSAIVSRA